MLFVMIIMISEKHFFHNQRVVNRDVKKVGQCVPVSYLELKRNVHIIQITSYRTKVETIAVIER